MKSNGRPEKQRILTELILGNPALAERLHTGYLFNKADVVYAARFEMAITIEDFLARRIRLLFLDARAAIEVSEEVAKLMAVELDKDHVWVNDQVNSFKELAQQYLLA